MTAASFEFHTDPGHGWLKVRVADLADLGMTIKEFSEYSYIGRDGSLYLEEDCDASKFFHAYKIKHGFEPATTEIYCNRESPVRAMRRNVK